MDIRLEYDPQPRQALLHASDARQILYGGAAGGGKSHSLRWDAIGFCLNNPGLEAYLFRKTLPALERNHIRRLRSEIPPELGSYNFRRNAMEFYNGSVLHCCYSEYDKDIEENFQGAEMPWLGIDEAGQFTEWALNYLKTRNRVGLQQLEKWPDKHVLPRCVFSANPGGVSHHYLKRVFIDRAQPKSIFFDETMKDPKDPDDRGWRTVFIPAKLDDNKYLDGSYAAQFGGLPEHLQKMLRDGDWNVVAGAFFDCWSTERHVLRPFKIPSHWTRFRAGDWGHATPFSIGWYAVASDDYEVNGTIIPSGSMIKYREWYGEQLEGSDKGLRMDASEVGKKIKKLESDERISFGVLDPSAWRVDSGPSPAEKMIKAGVHWRRADNKREPGWQEMYTRLKGGRLFFFSTCRSSIRTIPVVVSDEKNPEDVDKGPGDHAADETRYACMARPWRGERAKEREPLVKVPTFNDLMSEAKKRNQREHWL